jgi:hypothetical protein
MKTQNQDYSKPYLIENQSLITIFLTIPQSPLRKVSVSKYAHVSIILSLFPPGKKTIFCGGSVIDQKKTFHELCIKTLSRLLVINGENLSLNREMFWKKATKNDAELSRRLQSMKNPLAKRDFSKIADMMMMKMENKTSNVKRVIRMNWMMKREENEEEQQTSAVTEYEKKMNETALPILW